MIRLGLKLTHDGGLAVLDGTRLVLSHEAEKSANLARHSTLDAIDVEHTLSLYGMSLGDIDRVVVDGWIDGKAALRRDGGDIEVPVAPYHENDRHRDPLAPVTFSAPLLGERPTAYESYPHATGHAIGTYATSPWARTGEPALVLVWDGAMLPRLYHVTAGAARLVARPLFGFVGHIHPVLGSYYGPFVPNGGAPVHDELATAALLGLSGKIMAWAGLGDVDERLLAVFEDVYTEKLDLAWAFVFDFTRTVFERTERLGARHEDVLASFQAYLGNKLVEGLRKAVARNGDLPRRLCFTGGCALNIAWNARLRGSGLFEDVWVPPFPNDAGSALGAAVADLVRSGDGLAIDWDVYRGPDLVESTSAAGWSGQACDLAELARVLDETGAPVIFLHGRAELGPRALGNRSILCAAVSEDVRERINHVKQREWYRPVAPICLESDAPQVFDPGTPDPYMLFTHLVRPQWRERVPAIVHVDGTARLQTISPEQNPVVAKLLFEYRARTGIPLLCNTSANLKGSGFFPDLHSATAWPGAQRVWCADVLYTRAAQPSM